MSIPTLPNTLIMYDRWGRPDTEVVGLEEPELLAHEASSSARRGQGARAMLIWAALVADRRCMHCGRQVYAAKSLTSGFGEHCSRRY